jgi:hypothetical protein
MNPLIKLRSVARDLEATVENDSGGGVTSFVCVAPEGYVWKATGDRQLFTLTWMQKEEREFAITDAIERMSLGIERK